MSILPFSNYQTKVILFKILHWSRNLGLLILSFPRKPSHGLTKQNQNVTKDDGRKTNTIQHFISKFALVKKFGVANPAISKKTLSRFNKAKSKCNEGQQKKDEYNTALYFKFCIGQENWGC